MLLPLDFDAPNITAPNDVSINCGDSISPTVTGNPNISDSEDTSPVVAYEDEDGSGCFIIRTWSATDRAGNTAKKQQKLTIVSVSPINVFKILFYIPEVYLGSCKTSIMEHLMVS